MNVARLVLESVERIGERVSTHFEGKSYTNVERLRYAERLAAVLREKGVRPGDRVVVMMPNSPAVTGSFHAVWRVGGVIIPVTPQLVAREVGYIIAHSGAKIVLTHPALVSRLREAVQASSDGARLYVRGDADWPGETNLEALVQQAEPIRTIHDSAPADLAMLIYTSGTTGQPKGVMQTHANLRDNALACAPLARLTPDTMTLHVLPLSHVFGVLCMNLGAIYGCRSVLLPHWDTRRAFEAIQQFRVQRVSVVPTMLSYLLNFPQRQQYDCSSLEVVSSGGAPLAEEVRLQFERAFRCRVKNGYGCSEATCSISGYRDEEPHRPGSAGRPIAGMELAILDGGDRPVPTGVDGEVCVSGPHVSQGYWRDEEATRLATRNGWLHTGDLGRVDADRYLYITSRKKDLIIKGGENIAPRSIEEALYEHPAVAEAAVVGVPDPLYGEDICAVVALKPGLEAGEEELKEHVARYVSRFKVPARVVFRAELPKSSVGKILKRELRKELADAIP